MDTILLISLILTLIYIGVRMSGNIISSWYDRLFKIDVLFPLLCGSWACYAVSNVFPLTVSLITAAVLVILILTVQLAVHSTNKRRSAAASGNAVSEAEKAKYEEEYNNAFGDFLDKTGEVEIRLNGNYYLGTFQRSETSPKEEIMVHCDEVMKAGDRFVIRKFENCKFIAERVKGNDGEVGN